MTSQNKFIGLININKEVDYTSNDVVQLVRKILKMKKVGHTGTLDPNVTGVLPICLGNATRIAEYVQDAGKTYKGTMRLGASSDSLDASGKILSSSSYIPSMEEILTLKERFVGKIKQIPPMFSAVHHNGVRLHELARKGIEVEREAREVTIYSFDIISYQYPFIDFICSCSKGTYIRTLVDDFGKELTSYALLEKLERTKVSNFSIDKSIKLEELKQMVDRGDLSFLRKIEDSLPNLEELRIEESYMKKILNGMTVVLSYDISYLNNKIFKLYCGDKFIGIGYKPYDQLNNVKVKKLLCVED